MSDEILNDISHRRYNPLSGSWLLVSPHRTKRPWQGQQETPSDHDLRDHDPHCYLCPGNTRAQGDRNPIYQTTFAFVNDYSAVREDQTEYKTEGELDDPDALLFRAESVAGKCYVLTFSPIHNVTLADMSADAIRVVVETWTHVYATHLSPTHPLADTARQVVSVLAPPPDGIVPRPASQLRYMQIFENKGPAMGCSNPHPHCQIWTTSRLPEEPARELAQLSRYRRERGGRHMLGDYASREMQKAERVVWQNDAFVTVCPWWAVWPFEVLIISKRHVRALVDLDDEGRTQFAEAIRDVTRRYDNLFETSFPYSSGIHQAPLDGSGDEIESSWLHMHFYPPLLRSATVRKFLVGYELLAEPQRDITPEQAAARLRECGGDLYREGIH